MSSRHTLRAALLGQVLAFIIAVTAVSSTQLARQVKNAHASFCECVCALCDASQRLCTRQQQRRPL